VLRVDRELVTVRSQPLVWDGRALRLGRPAVEQAVGAAGGLALAGGLRQGDRVALHWDWVCERLTARQLAALRHYTMRHLEIVNRVRHPGPAAVLS